MKNKILFWEDHKYTRDGVLTDSEGNLIYKNIIAPRSYDECLKTEINTDELVAGLFDLNLSAWTGITKDRPIMIKGKECFDGFDVAKVIHSIDEDLPIGIYSSNKVELNKVDIAIKNNRLNKSISVIHAKPNEPNKHITDFFDKHHQIDVSILPMFKESEIPLMVKSFFSRKLLRPLNKGEYVWKAGQFSWLVAVNQKLSIEHQIELTPYKYELFFDKSEYLVSRLRKCDSGIILNNETVQFHYNIYNQQNFETDRVLHDIFWTNHLCKKYLDKEMSFDELSKNLICIGDFAKFESQRYLYKNLKNKYINMKSKEDIYELLKPFNEIGFPKVMDVFEGIVKSVDNDLAHLKLNSNSPENNIKLLHIDKKLLDKFHLEKDSKFEYSIFTQVDSSFSTNSIEPM